MPTASQVAPLLDLDPDLGGFLDDTRFEDARRTLHVRVRRLGTGPWNTARLTVADAGHLGLLVLDGVLSREVLASDVISTELIGPGELLRPWQIAPDAALLRIAVRWNVLSEARVAVLDRRLASQLGGYPEIVSVLVERMSARAQRLAVAQAICQLNRVDRRLLTLFWHLAERWGRMTGHGVAIPLTLSHRMLAQLVGARRPTVSTALGELARDGQVVRQEDGSWLLIGEPVGEPAAALVRNIPPRRRMLAAVPADGDEPEVETIVADVAPTPAHGALERREVLTRLERVREEAVTARERFADGRAAATELRRRSSELRERLGNSGTA